VHRPPVHRVRRLRRHLPGVVPDHHGERRGGGAADATERARDQPHAGPLRVGAAPAHEARDDQGRRRLRPLRALRGALPDGRVGHAEVRARNPLRRQALRDIQMTTRINDFAIKLANVNGTGSASANGLLMQAIFRMGIPVSGKNLFPSNIQGLPTWYEIRVNAEGHTARTADYDLMVAMNAETYARDVKEVRSGGYVLYDSTWPLNPELRREDVTFLGVPYAQMCNEAFRT